MNNPTIKLLWNRRTAYTYILGSRNLYSKHTERQIQECYTLLNLPLYAKQSEVRKAFLELAKKYHPDSGSPDANIEKFVAIENAFRLLSKYNTGVAATEEVEKIVYDLKHTAPQHRQYLSYEGLGHGTPFQREKQYIQAKAQKAAINVMEHRVSKAMASDKAIMMTGQYKKHDIKTKYGFDRLVEDFIQEAMSKGEFDNLSGKGKPLKDQNRNPYVDFTTHKLNEVLINNGFTPEWIMMSKEIEEDIEGLKEAIRSERKYLGPCPLTNEEISKWESIREHNRLIAKSLNSKIDTYNLIVPLINKQKFHVEFDKICDDILNNGPHSVEREVVEEEIVDKPATSQEADFIGTLFKAFEEIFNTNKEKNKS